VPAAPQPSHGHSHVRYWVQAAATMPLSRTMATSYGRTSTAANAVINNPPPEPSVATTADPTNHPLTKPLSCASQPQHAQCVTTLHLQIPLRLGHAPYTPAVASRVCSCCALPAAELPAATLCRPSSSCSILTAASSFSPTCTRSHLQPLNTYQNLEQDGQQNSVV